MNRAVLSLFPLSALAVATAVAMYGCNNDDNNSAPASTTPKTLVSVDFTETAAPAATDIEKMSKTYTESKAVFTYSDGSKVEYPLAYTELFNVKSEISEVAGKKYPSGQLYNYRMEPLKDPYGQPVIAETPDSNSLLKIGSKLFLVTHYEYDWLLSDGKEAWTTAGWYTRSPMSMTLSELTQDANTGKLTVKSQKPIDFSSVNGIWIPCFGSQTPWNTHLGSEEDYDLIYNPLTTSYKTTTNGLKALTEQYFDNTKQANPYQYGIIPEVTVKEDGSTSVVKHYAMGRGTWEMAKVMPDQRTVYLGDDGANVQMTMFVADKAGDLSAGTLYVAKWNQTSDQNGGVADLTWYKIGKATNAEIKAIVDGGVKFSDIWDAVAPVDAVAPATNKTCPDTYMRVRAGSSSDECIKLKPGMEKAAAFLETRRYAAYVGATTEWTKMEGIAVNAKDKKLYMAMSRIETSMKSDATGPVDHIKLPENKAGATYTLDLKGGQKTANGGEAINSDYVATKMYVEPKLLGKPISTDAKGNTADENTVANTDNVFFSEKLRTLFIGEDSGMHVNNYVWAYNVDTQKLTRILSSTAGAENTGLQVLEDLNGHAYIMSNNQHWGDLPSSVPATLKTQLSIIDKFKAPIGYIGGMPAIK